MKILRGRSIYSGFSVLTVTIQCVHTSEMAATALTHVWSYVIVQLLVTFAIVLPCESFITSWPLALERTLFIM